MTTPPAYSEEKACLYDKHRSSVRDTSVFACRIEAVRDECRQFFKDNPDLLKYANDCSNPSDDRWVATRWSQTCGSAALREFKKWGNIFSRLEEAGKLIDACNERLECKKNIAAQAYFVCKNADGSNQYPCTDEKILKDVEIRDLLRKRLRLRALARGDKDRAELEAKGVPIPEIIEDAPLDELLAARRDELGLKSKCLNTAANIRTACMAIATAVDPTILIGTGPSAGPLVGLKFVAAALKATSGSAIEASTTPKIKLQKGN